LVNYNIENYACEVNNWYSEQYKSCGKYEHLMTADWGQNMLW
jgi:hypothetical protein